MAVSLTRDQAGHRRRRPGLRRRSRLLPVLPAVVLLLVFLAGPVLWAFHASFTNAALTGRNARNPGWIGFDNYARLLSDPMLPLSLGLTVLFVGGSAILGQNLLGLTLAVLMRRARRPVAAVVGTAVVAAWVLPEIVAAFAAYAYFSRDGTLNQVLGGLGFGQADWLYSFPMVAILLANIWRGTAFSLLVYRAALNDIPGEVTEAALMDGAGGWQRLAFITIPMIRGSIATNLMLITLQTLAVFTLIWVMTAGGPANTSTTLPVLAYLEAFKFGDIGYGTAVASVLILIGVVFGAAYVRLLREAKP
ncbi:carbohydrate ABC transporter permease [Pseudarthrobacter sp. NBSH8]|uniref:carbohydrate ABC transporter permease n=1 Tax=Pseudarthrobacter sp. NBSH8 TaxID=2596911 RepID=UPI001626DA49|nr:sugar ABC transporter permease [Pseudarthrobacter sp. NBSH8]QNE14884.1 sugar ABC transporter permease [Pseudarthrobacter sp. NBSH8]